jgi:hypothetical protein
MLIVYLNQIEMGDFVIKMDNFVLCLKKELNLNYNINKLFVSR